MPHVRSQEQKMAVSRRGCAAVAGFLLVIVIGYEIFVANGDHLPGPGTQSVLGLIGLIVVLAFKRFRR